MNFIDIPAGTLWQGSTEREIEDCVQYWSSRLVDQRYTIDAFRCWLMKEFPRHAVRMDAYRIAQFPVTNADYRKFCESTGRVLPESLQRDEGNRHPVWGVSLQDAEAFAQWFGAKNHVTYSIPSEPEWEYAARGPMHRAYPFGESFDPAKCNTIESGLGQTTPVDRYLDAASLFGVSDLAGNVEEWTVTPYEPYPGGKWIEDDISDACGPRYIVLRGGSFALGGDLARCARRHGPHPAPEFRYRGFRLVIRAV